MRLVRLFTGLLAAIIAVTAATMAAPPPAAAAGDQLQTHVDSTYELQPARGMVHVTQAISLTNRKASSSRSYSCTQSAFAPYYGWYEYQTTCTTRTNYYYKWSTFYIEKDAVNVKVKAGTGTARLDKGKVSGNWRLWKIHYSHLYYGNTRKLTLSYDLKGGGPRSGAARLTGWASARFCVAGPSGDTGRVRAVVPKGFAMTTSATMSSRVSGGDRIFDSGKLKRKPWAFWACLNGIDPTAVESTPTTLADGTQLTVSAWKGDTAWAEAAEGAVADLAPMFETLGDSDLPEVMALEEATASSWEAATGTRQLGEDQVDREAIVEDLARRAWFSPDTFPQGWILGGYIEWARYAGGADDVACEDPTAGGLGTVPDLATWVRPARLSSAELHARWAEKVEAACWIMRSLDEAMGREAMLGTINALRDRVDPWSPDQRLGDNRVMAFTMDQWLDVVTELGLVRSGADPRLAADLLVAFGLEPDAEAMAAHEAARDAYHDYMDSTGSVPAFVVKALRDEATAEAQAALDTASEALATAATVETILPDVDVATDKVALAVEGATCQEDLDAAAALAARQAALAAEAADAFAAEAEPRDAIQTLGLLGTTLPSHAVVLAAVGDVDEAAVSSGTESIRAALDGAREAGTGRALLIGGGVAGAVLALAALGWLLHRRRSHRTDATPGT